jgi:hypothetical protein
MRRRFGGNLGANGGVIPRLGLDAGAGALAIGAPLASRKVHVNVTPGPTPGVTVEDVKVRFQVG